MEQRQIQDGDRHLLRRRDLIAMLGTASLAWPVSAHAAPGRPRIAILALQSKEGFAINFGVFLEGLRLLGYVEGQTIDVDARYAGYDVGRLAALMRELMQAKPSAILADTPSAAVAAHEVAPAVPVVCPIITSALIPRLAKSYAHPGGSVTGLSNFVEGMYGKLVELALDAIPGVTKIGLLVNPSSVDFALYRDQIAAAAQTRGVELVVIEAATADEVRTVFARFVPAQAPALIVAANALFITMQSFIVETALNAHVALFFGASDGVKAGGLASYGVNATDNYRRAALYVDKILKGTPPGDLPIEFPTKFELYVNLKTANALGLTIPPSVLVRADEVIE